MVFLVTAFIKMYWWNGILLRRVLVPVLETIMTFRGVLRNIPSLYWDRPSFLELASWTDLLELPIKTWPHWTSSLLLVSYTGCLALTTLNWHPFIGPLVLDPLNWPSCIGYLVLAPLSYWDWSACLHLSVSSYHEYHESLSRHEPVFLVMRSAW